MRINDDDDVIYLIKVGFLSGFYRYVVAIGILSTLYTGLQVLRQIHELSSTAQYFSRQNLAMVDFIGDQVSGLFLKKKFLGPYQFIVNALN